MRGLQRSVAHEEKSSAAALGEEGGAGQRLSRFVSRGRDILILVALVGAMYYIGRLDYVRSGQIRDLLRGFGAGAPLAFVSLCVVTAIVFVPPTLPIGLGSIAFGHARGGVFSLLGLSLGACAAYLLGRHVAANLITRLQGRRAALINTWIAKSNNFPCMLSLRLIFFCDPTFNYLSGATRRITPRVYASATVLGLIPRTFMISYFFELFMQGTLRDILTNPLVLSFPLLRLAGVLLLTVLIKRPARAVV